MYKKLITFLFAFAPTGAFAQIPNFPETCGADTTNGYTSISFPPGTNSIESYSPLQYGIGQYFAAGIELCTAPE
ncbi:MAG: hypothetical protein MJZ24_11085, partial [Paludibacteraceae bacterium]|nr:hypothetical protein [Paludibacteraceae bacterium]